MRNNRYSKTIFLAAVFLAATLLQAHAQEETLVTGQVTAAGPDHETIVGVKVAVKGTTTGTVTDLLFPIPPDELILNPLLEQNPGW